MNKLKYSASGKLLLFGEYLVLRGAKSIAVPVKYGQSLTISATAEDNITWQSFEKGKLWFEVILTPSLEIIHASDKEKAAIVQRLLQIIQAEKPELEISNQHFRFDIDFDRNYGLGTSSTFLSLLGQWSGVNPFLLQEKSFRGSGFDIAAATASQAIIYQVQQRNDGKERVVIPFDIPDNISSQLLFVYTGKKQTSLSEVLSFSSIETPQWQITEMNTIVDEVVQCSNIEAFENLMNRSEQLMSQILQTETIKEKQFHDYPFSVKSLGAWGGDFIMATFRDETLAREYFQHKEMNPIFDFRQLVKK